MKLEKYKERLDNIEQDTANKINRWMDMLDEVDDFLNKQKEYKGQEIFSRVDLVQFASFFHLHKTYNNETKNS